MVWPSPISNLLPSSSGSPHSAVCAAFPFDFFSRHFTPHLSQPLFFETDTDHLQDVFQSGDPSAPLISFLLIFLRTLYANRPHKIPSNSFVLIFFRTLAKNKGGWRSSAFPFPISLFYFPPLRIFQNSSQRLSSATIEFLHL